MNEELAVAYSDLETANRRLGELYEDLQDIEDDLAELDVEPSELEMAYSDLETAYRELEELRDNLERIVDCLTESNGFHSRAQLGQCEDLIHEQECYIACIREFIDANE
jgi:chromosome segregation ATPase